jgi:membrane associated rhomboid family serine protease
VSQPDLFVVCKNCGSEVSPYVTECPYCGQRVRKRAPKINRDSGEPTTKRRRRATKLPRLRAEEIAGIAPDTRPYATGALILVCLVGLLLFAADPDLSVLDPGYLFVSQGADDDIWRWFTTPFLHADQLGYALVALFAVGLFGTLLERRFGPVVVVLAFILTGAAGSALAAVLETPPLLAADVTAWPVMGANGAALGLLCAWLVDDRLARRRGDDRENDLLGVYVIAAVLVLLSLTTEEANIGAAIGGAVAGAVIGLLLPQLTRAS